MASNGEAVEAETEPVVDSQTEDEISVEIEIIKRSRLILPRQQRPSKISRKTKIKSKNNKGRADLSPPYQFVLYKGGMLFHRVK
jgi:hypothetical protein